MPEVKISTKRDTYTRGYTFNLWVHGVGAKIYQAHRSLTGRWVLTHGRDRLGDDFKTITAIEAHLRDVHERGEVR